MLDDGRTVDEKDYHRMYEEQHRRVASWSGLKPCWRDLREAITREFFVLSLLWTRMTTMMMLMMIILYINPRTRAGTFADYVRVYRDNKGL